MIILKLIEKNNIYIINTNFKFFYINYEFLAIFHY